MLGKPWGQLSIEEQVERLRQQIAEILGRADTNAMIMNQQLKTLRDRIDNLEKRRDQSGSGAADPQQGDP
jgi:hypothetical protein